MHPPMAAPDSRTPSPELMKEGRGRLSPDPTESMSTNSGSPQLEFFPSTAPNPSAQPKKDITQENFPRVITTPVMSDPQAPASATQHTEKSKSNPSRRKNAVKGRLQNTTGEETTVKRRQKRLERNRESARLSRRRRKQYLEVLEENVNQLSRDVDRGRREHVARAIWTIHQKRVGILTESASLDKLEVLEKGLSRTSYALRVVNTFQWQQLQSFALPPSTKFTLWLSLQNDEYFRGGRAASERLSAARIGERMLTSGTDKATPLQSMWPLFCNEVGLSYEQEEKVRTYQRALLQTPESWLHRHTAFAAEKTMKAVHDAIEALTNRLAERENASQSILSPAQRLNLATWATRNRQKLKERVSHLPRKVDSEFKLLRNQHEAVSLYIVNHRLQGVLKSIPLPDRLAVEPAAVKKLSRRPLFESLGCGSSDKEEGLSRDNSFASTGSLKRGMAEMSMGGEEGEEELVHLPPLNPEDAQNIALELVDKVLGPVKSIIPDAPVTSFVSFDCGNLVLPAPTPVSSMQYFPVESVQPSSVPSASIHTPVPEAATALNVPLLETVYQDAHGAKHARNSSFLPQNLNVVPEEMWAGDADDLLMNLVDGDWAIGEGIDMDAIHQ